MSSDFCNQHSGHEARMTALEGSREVMWKAIDRSHERLDGMKNWVIAGMTSLVIQLILFIGGIILVYTKVP